MHLNACVVRGLNQPRAEHPYWSLPLWDLQRIEPVERACACSLRPEMHGKQQANQRASTG